MNNRLHRQARHLLAAAFCLFAATVAGLGAPAPAAAGCAQHTWTQGYAGHNPITIQTKAATLDACASVGPNYCEGPWTIINSDWNALDGLQVYLQVDTSVTYQYYLLWLDAAFTQPVNTAPAAEYRAGCLGLEMEPGHATCGNGVKEGVEDCDGADASNCPGLCQGDCTCPAPVCGNDITEFGEECDGTEVSGCTTGTCQGDCTCLPPPYDKVSCFQHLWDPSNASNPYTTLQMKWGCNGFTPSQWDLIPGATDCASLHGQPMTIVESTWTSLNGAHVYLDGTTVASAEWFLMWADAAMTVPVLPTPEEAAAAATPGYLPGCDGGGLAAGHLVFAACGDGNLDDGEECDDGNTDDGDCCSATCTFEPNGATCPEDGNPCTDEACDGAGACVSANNSDPCDDTLYCSVGDTCAGGTCAGTARDCSGLDSDCAAGVCNEDSDACEALAANEDGPCDDGDACTLNDICLSGVCAASGETNSLDSAKITLRLRPGANDDVLKLRARLPLSQLGDLASAPGMEFALADSVGGAVHTATIASANVTDIGDKGIAFRFRDNAGAVAEANGVYLAWVKLDPNGQIAKVRARGRDLDASGASGAGTLTLQLILGEGAETACSTGFDLPCKAQRKKMVCEGPAAP